MEVLFWKKKTLHFNFTPYSAVRGMEDRNTPMGNQCPDTNLANKMRPLCRGVCVAYSFVWKHQIEK